MALSQNGRSSRRRTNDAGQPQPTRQAREAGGHLPSAPRERRPLLAALAVLLIVGGALLAGLLAMRLDQRVQMLAAKDTIKAGQVIDKEDLVSASVSSDLTTLVRADQIDQVVGRTPAWRSPRASCWTPPSSPPTRSPAGPPGRRCLRQCRALPGRRPAARRQGRHR